MDLPPLTCEDVSLLAGKNKGKKEIAIAPFASLLLTSVQGVLLESTGFIFKLLNKDQGQTAILKDHLLFDQYLEFALSMIHVATKRVHVTVVP